MGGSTLGAQAIYDFLNHKIKKNFYFIDNLQTNRIKCNKKKLQIWSYRNLEILLKL